MFPIPELGILVICVPGKVTQFLDLSRRDNRRVHLQYLYFTVISESTQFFFNKLALDSRNLL